MLRAFNYVLDETSTKTEYMDFWSHSCKTGQYSFIMNGHIFMIFCEILKREQTTCIYFFYFSENYHGWKIMYFLKAKFFL